MTTGHNFRTRYCLKPGYQNQLHWSKGWIIEDNIIHDAKCSGISIGKEVTTGHNFRTRYCLKPGYQNQLESVFSAVQKGWSKETIGSSGISIGKEVTTGHNFRTRYCLKPGYQNQLESVFSAVQKGWSKETIGSHIIRRNRIYDWYWKRSDNRTQFPYTILLETGISESIGICIFCGSKRLVKRDDRITYYLKKQNL